MLVDKLFNSSTTSLFSVSSGGGEGEIATHLDNLGTIFDKLFDTTTFGEGGWVNQLYFLMVALTLVIIGVVGYRKRSKIPNTRLQCFLEIVVDSFTNLTTDVLGPKGKVFTAYIGTLFVFILIMNLLGMVPLGHSPTTSLNVTAAMAICTFLLVQFHGLRQNGFLGYIRHLIGDPWWLFPLNFPLHVIGELAKPFSLSLRLFGNITGEDALIAVMVALAALIFGAYYVPLPFQFCMYPLAILGSTIQAFVFAILTAVYLALMMAHGHED